MDMPKLRAFVYAAQLRSISKAATQLRIAQPALSRHIKGLESELGVALLVRHGRGVRPTEAGETLLRRGEMLLRQLRQTRDEVLAQAGTASGQLTLAMPPAAGLTLASQLIERYRRRCPNVSLHVLAGLSGSIREWVHEGRVDVALLHNPPRATDLTTRPLLIEDLYVIAPPAAAMKRLPAGVRTVPRAYRPDDIARLPLILPSHPHSLRLQVEEAAARRGLRLDVILEVNDLSIIKALIQRGVGLSVFAYNAVQQEVARRALRAVPIEPPISWTLGFAINERQPTRAARELVALIEVLVAELVAAGTWRGRLVGSAPGD